VYFKFAEDISVPGMVEGGVKLCRFRKKELDQLSEGKIKMFYALADKNHSRDESVP
jgi:hypothetical protein